MKNSAGSKILGSGTEKLHENGWGGCLMLQFYFLNCIIMVWIMVEQASL